MCVTFHKRAQLSRAIAVKISYYSPGVRRRTRDKAVQQWSIALCTKMRGSAGRGQAHGGRVMPSLIH